MELALLLVDDEPNILSSLTRVFRRDGYTLYSAGSGEEALAILQREQIGVIISDQRMPNMTGAEFLALAKNLRPQTIRIILSGYTDLNTVIKAINTGAAFKFLTKPWEEDALREHVREAFHQYSLIEENARLTRELTAANGELNRINQELERLVEEKVRELVSNISTLRVAQEILDQLPIGVIGIANDGLIACSNQLASALLDDRLLVGMFAEDVLPAVLYDCYCQQGAAPDIVLQGRELRPRCCSLGQRSSGQGSILLLIPAL